MKAKILPILIALTLISCSSDRKDVIETSSSIEATEIDIRSIIPGKIKKIYVNEGDFVKQNDTLITLDVEELQIQLKQAEANLRLAEAKLKTILTGVREEDKIQLRELLKQAEINFENAKRDYERIQNLFLTESVSQKVYDDARQRYEIADAQLKVTRENLLKAERGPLTSEIEAGRATVDQAKAQVELLQKKIRDAVIISPVNGYVSLINYEISEFVNPGSLLTKVTNLDEVYAKIYVKENDLGKVRLKQKAILKVDAYPDKDFEGEISFISSEAEFTPKNIQTKDERVKLVYAVKVNVKNPDHLLRSGMLCDVYLKINN